MANCRVNQRQINTSSVNDSSSQFETCMRPSILALKLLGFSINLTNPDGFKVFGFVYSLLLCLTVLSCSIVVTYIVFSKVDGNFEEEFIVKLLLAGFALDTIFAIVLPVVSWTESKYHIKYLKEWRYFSQVVFKKATNSELVFRSERRNTILSVILILHFTVWGLTDCFVIGAQVVLLKISMFHTCLACGYYTLFWNSSCHLLALTADQFLNLLRKELEEEPSQKVKILLRYQTLWLDVSTLAQRLGRNFGCTYNTCILYMFSIFTIETYSISVCIAHGDYEIIALLLPEVITLLFLVFVMGNSAQLVKYKIEGEMKEFLTLLDKNVVDEPLNKTIEGEMKEFLINMDKTFTDDSSKKTTEGEMKEFLINIEKTLTDDSLKKTISEFLKRIEYFPADITLCDFVSVNRRLLVSLGEMYATYIIVLIQFELAHKSHDH